MLATTDSDYFVYQISNFVMMSRLDQDYAVKLGYSAGDYLKAEEVGAYLFHFDESGDGSLITELEVTDEDGIPEEQFFKIAEAVYNETVTLQHLRTKSR